jgi:uncharacterized protein (TIGR03437 family)
MSGQTVLWFAFLALLGAAPAQDVRTDWRRIGNAAMDLSLASVATGPVNRVWFAEDGSRLYARTAAGVVFVTDDFEKWVAAPPGTVPPPIPDFAATRKPEAGAPVRARSSDGGELYAIGRFVYRSEDDGATWSNLTGYRNSSLIGNGLMDVAASPRNANEVVVAAATGVWRSVDAGRSWTGLNEGLPNIPVRRILATPLDARGVRIQVNAPAGEAEMEWTPGEKQAWRRSDGEELKRRQELERSLSETLRARITAVAVSGDYLYAGSSDGRIWASNDGGRSWRPNPDAIAAPVESIFVDPREPRLALAALGARLPGAPAGVRTPHVLRTTNGGAFWDDLTANLPDVAAWGVAADRPSGAIYLATDRGLYLTFGDLVNPGPATQWVPAGAGLPPGRASDVRLDAAGNQIYVSIDGYGVYAAPAPHRVRSPRVVNAADMNERPAAPGAVLSVVGANVRSARAGSLNAPVLAATPTKSEIQVPFEARGTSLSLALEAATGALTLVTPLQNASPAILVDEDGSPVALDADSGVLLDAMNPAHSNSRIQVLATGLGQVTPEWPTGMPAPLENTPRVVAPVRAYLDRNPVEVVKATLAPGYIGFYLIELQIPRLVNYGPAELYLEVDGEPSNRVRVYIEP